MMIIIEIILEALLIICAIFVIFYMSFMDLTPMGMTFKESNKMFVKYTKKIFRL